MAVTGFIFSGIKNAYRRFSVRFVIARQSDVIPGGIQPSFLSFALTLTLSFAGPVLRKSVQLLPGNAGVIALDTGVDKFYDGVSPELAGIVLSVFAELLQGGFWEGFVL